MEWVERNNDLRSINERRNLHIVIEGEGNCEDQWFTYYHTPIETIESVLTLLNEIMEKDWNS